MTKVIQARSPFVVRPSSDSIVSPPTTFCWCSARLTLGRAGLHVQLIGAILGDRRLECTQRQRRATRPGIDDFAAEMVDHIVEVHLVDLFHPQASRWRVRRLRNVHLVSTDITATLEAVWLAGQESGHPLPRSTPDLFVGDPDVDLAVSVNRRVHPRR